MLIKIINFSYKKRREIISHLFLLLLLIIALGNFTYLEKFIDLSWVKKYQTTLTIMTIATGGLTFWYNRKRIKKETEEEKNQEEKAEEKRKKAFANKFPRINKIPILKNLMKWMYKEGWRYSLRLLMILMLFSVISTYKLGNFELREDEYQVVDAAAGYHYTGEFYTWDWINQEKGERYYDRAWPHTWLIAQVYEIFGISEWSSRIISAIFGILFILSSYFIIKFFTENKNISLLTILIFIFYSNYINFFRYTRMYAILAPVFLILSYLLYKGITGKNTLNFKFAKINNCIEKNLNFNYAFIFIGLIFLILNYLIHINSLIILPAILLFIIYLSIIKKDRKYILFSITGVVGLIIVYLLYYFKVITNFSKLLSFFEMKNYPYLEFLLGYPFSKEIALILLLLGLLLFFILKNNLRDKIAFLYIITVFSLIFFIWIAKRYSSFLYTSHVSVISIILLVSIFYWIAKIYKFKLIKYLLYLILFLVIFTQFYVNFDRLYGNNHPYGRYRDAYKTILENYDSKNQVIFGQYLRKYYLKDLGENVNFISMLKAEQYEFSVFLDDLKKHESGWITWESRKSYHIKQIIRDYICNNFVQKHGESCGEIIDNTKVEVFYFNQDMIK